MAWHWTAQDAYIFLAIAGLGAITWLTRGFFLMPQRDVRLPDLIKEGLQYAPLAALAAVIAPELVLTQGHWSMSWHDPRLYAVAVASAYYAWRRSILGTIVSGTVVMVLMRTGVFGGV